jgi:hypothetical protein
VAATAFVYVHERSTLLGGGGITRGRPEWRAAPTVGDQSYRPARSTTRLCRRRWHPAIAPSGASTGLFALFLLSVVGDDDVPTKLKVGSHLDVPHCWSRSGTPGRAPGPSAMRCPRAPSSGPPPGRPGEPATCTSVTRSSFTALADRTDPDPVHPPPASDARCSASPGRPNPSALTSGCLHSVQRTRVGGRGLVGLVSGGADVGPVGYAGWAAQVTLPSGDVVGHRMTLLVSGP